MDRWQGGNFGWIVLRQMQPSLAVPAGYTKKCLMEFLQDHSSNRMHNFPIQMLMLTTGPMLFSSFFFFFTINSYWNAGLASTQRICF